MKEDLLIARYKQHRSRHRLYIAGILLFLMVASVTALIIGGSMLGWNEVYKVLEGSSSEASRLILLNVRLPRVMAALLCGAALAVSGSVMQILLRNPLASPYTLGISNAAAFGAAVAIVFMGAGSAVQKSGDMFIVNNPYLVTISAFAGSLIGLSLILMIAKVRKATPETIILSGVIISSLFGAGIAAMQYVANNVQLASIVFWNFGDLGKSDWTKLFYVSVVTIPMIIYFYMNRWNYKALRAGDEYAASLGVNAERLRITGMIITALSTAVVVSFFGVIAFVGLVVPHIVRKIIGTNEEFLIPASALFGGMFLVLCDMAARLVLSPVIIPVGILTSFLGVPVFLFFLIRKNM
ncbi:MAG: FecCD family ABC transporter permease [Bacteroidales bacterium]